MPITRSSFVRTNIILMVLGLLALLAIIGSTLWLVERSETYFDQVIEARDARTAAADLRTALQDIETSQRGYLITLEESYLDPYFESRDDVIPRFERLEEILASYPQATQAVANLRRAIDRKLAEVDETIRLARDDDMDAARVIVATDEGKERMDQARELLAAVIAAADERVTTGVEDQRQVIETLRWAVLLGGAVILVVVGGAVWTAGSYTADLTRARSEVEALAKDLEGRVEERTQELMRANEEVQRFAYIVTHDLRAPLVNIMGFTSELGETMKSIQSYVLADGEERSAQEREEARIAAAEDLPEAIGFIRSSTQKMDGLINAILKISRDGRRALKPEKIDLEELVEVSANALQHQVQETGGEIILDISVKTVVSDRLSLEQILGNLLDNAVKYRSKERPLEISVSTREAPGRLVLIEIADNGRGIADQDHQRVFDLFRRSGQQDQPGEGIGLAHVRTLVRNLGGDITLSSEYCKGTTFTVVLPRDVRTVQRSTSI